MKSTVVVVVVALLSTLALTACSGEEAGESPATDATTQATAGARSTSTITLKNPAITVRKDVGYLTGILENPGDEDVKILSVVVSGYQIVRFGTREHDQVLPVEGGVVVKAHDSLTLGLQGTVIRVEVPTTERPAGHQTTVDIQFGDNTSLSTPVEVSTAEAH